MNSLVNDINALNQLEAKLQKQSFLGQNSMPGYTDACILKIIKTFQFIPDRKKYQNIFHWYIIMLQFSNKNISKWIQRGPKDQNTTTKEIIKKYEEYIFKTDRNKQQTKDSTSILISPQKLKSLDSQLQVIKALSKGSNDQWDGEYIIDIILKQGQQWQIIKSKLYKQKIDLIKFQMLDNNSAQIQIRIHFRINNQLMEDFKARVHQWQEVENIYIRNEKKAQKKLTIQ